MQLRIVASLVGVAFTSFFLIAGCSSGSTGDGSGNSSGGSGTSGGGGGGDSKAADCLPRCEAKGTSCGAPAAQAKKECETVCGFASADQLGCLERQSCSDLQAKDVDVLCPSGASAGSSGSSGSSGSRDEKFACSLNGTCYACDSSEAVQDCSIISGPGAGCTETDDSYCE